MLYERSGCHSRVGGNPVPFYVIPWLDHGIQDTIKILILLVFLTGSRDQVAG
ncbi:hypothetical protein [Rickettsia sp.]|uniref:hypothetical protein n=1 Tax=Rickettsia sp. TaxID=789 RepID=UPI00397E758E